MPEWILLGGLTPQAVTLYSLLLAHVNRKEGDGLAWPGLRTLAGMMGFRRHQSVHRYVQELEEVGAISVQRTKDGPTGNRNVYRINETPEENYTGVRSLGDFYALRRNQNRGLVRSTAQGLFPAGDKGLSAVDDQNQTNATRRIDPDEVTSSDAVSGRHFAGSTTDRKIFIPHWLKRCEDRGKVSQYLVGAAVATMEAAGLEVSEDAKDAMGFTLDHKCESLTNIQLSERAQAWVLAAGTGDRNGWLGTWPQRKAS
ncbi:hypothetical protein [Pseudonocardia sediminis]|nr:hypothetical protein [Pseudonocardia sediminis]